ncbi:FtsX-like permease family protein [Candidatus Parcubacteria bacterium]|nr:FtsX-like permease family protein [Candidatus Parcubacteria bacterium]
MRIRDLVEETYAALSANKARSGLTVLGIVIGIASVIALSAIGQGAQSSIQTSIQSIGSNLIVVMPGIEKQIGFGASGGRGTARSLTPEDESAIAAVTNVAAVSGELSNHYQVTVAGANTNTTVDGVDATYATIRNLSMDQGSFITDSQSSSLAKVAVIGPTVVTDLFGANAVASDAIGQNIRINNLQFTIIGVTKTKGGSGFGDQDTMIYIPLGTALQYFAGNGNRFLSTIDIQAASQTAMTQVQNDVTALLLTRHNISDPTKADFSILNQADLVSAASSVAGTLTMLLTAIAGISLIVGGIGIMNMMLTTVTERMREIGLRKAIGAKRKDINNQFLSEAIALTFIGGIIGIALGCGISFIVTMTGFITAQVTLPSILLAFGVSAGIGIVFGWYPARRASNLNPIDALRYE